MKSLHLFLFILIILQSFASNAEEPHKIKTDVKSVTLFLESAQVTRKANMNIGPGEKEIIFQNLSPFIDAKSIQVKLNGNATLLSVTHQINYLNKREKTQLEQKIDVLSDSLEYFNTKLDILKSEEDFLRQNQSIKGANSNLTLAELKNINQFFTQKFSDISWQRRTIGIRVGNIHRQIKDLQQQVEKINKDFSKLTAEITVKINSKASQSIDFEITYITKKAGWYPTYDIRAKDVNSPVELTYKANIHQNTGEEWNNIKLTLSNAENNVGNSLPNLNPWYLNYSYAYNNSYQPSSYTLDRNLTGNMVTGKVIGADMNEPIPGVNVMIKGTTIGTVTDVNGNFELQIPSSANTLTFSSLGYMREEVPINSNYLNIQMTPDVTSLEEVVVTGYGESSPGLLDLLRSKKPKKQEDAYQGPEVETSNYNTFVNFKVEETYSIPSNGENYTIDIAKHKLNAQYEYQCIPKLDMDAFLLARITNWQDLNLLDGEVNLFFEGTYVGRSLIDTKVLSDTMLLSLGRDQSISIERKKTKENSGTSLLGSKKINNQNWTIKVMNNKNQDINLTIYDQIPVSQRDDIKVMLNANPSGNYNELTGELKWELGISSEQSDEVRYGFEVTYPKNVNLRL